MTIATNVLNWAETIVDPDDPDGIELTTDEIQAPFIIKVVPEQPIQGVSFAIQIYAHDYALWNIKHSGAGGGGNLSDTVGFEDTKIETSTLSGGNEIETEFIPSSVDEITCITGLADENMQVIYSAGSRIDPLFYNTANGKITLTGEGYFGDIQFKYQTVRHKHQKIAGLELGNHFFLCKVNSARSQIVEINIGGDNSVIQQTIEVRDYCTDEIIQGAVVTIAGQALTTDANGIVVLNNIPSGQTLPVVITASGYHDSDADTLNNDEITT